MASLKDIRKRINSVKSTRQVTRALKLVSAAKLRRAQEAILNTRPYAYRIFGILLSLARKEGMTHPLLVERPEKKIRMIVLAGDRGQCGSFNAAILKEAQKFLKKKQAEGVEVTVDCIGKKSYDFFRKKLAISTYHEGVIAKATYGKASTIAEKVLEAYLNEEFDAIYLIYSEFKSAISQKPTVERLIPVSTQVPEGVVGIRDLSEEDKLKDYIFEPSKEAIMNAIVPRHFRMQLFRSILESVASEHGARMSAMESATKNATEMIDSLTLDYNKARQASITKELMEIVGGVEAMR